MRYTLLFLFLISLSLGFSNLMKEPKADGVHAGHDHASHAGETAEEHAAHAEAEAKENHDHGAEEHEHKHEDSAEQRKALLNGVTDSIRNRNYDLAKSDLEKFLKNHPNDEQALEQMGRLLNRGLNNPESALGYIRKVIEMNPENSRALSELRRAHELMNRPELAEKELTALLSKNPESSTVNEALGTFYADTNQYHRAEELLEKAAARSKMPEFPLAVLADSYRKQGDAGKAVKTYERILDHHTGKLKQAGDENERAAIEMEVAFTQLELAETLITERDFQKAEALLEQVRSKHPEAPVEILRQKIDMLRQG